MELEEKLKRIEELIGVRVYPKEVEIDEAIDIIYKHMELGLTYCLIKGRISSNARRVLSTYNFQIQTDTYTAGIRSDISNTIHWILKK